MPRMNGTERNIEIFKPFGEAFELMKRILFQPFDVKKWFVIGFAAWLANLGGGGFYYQYNRREDVQKLNEAISQIPHPILVIGVCVLISLVLVLIVLFAWLRARGGFMFIDCIVKNRGAVAEPWREFRKEGNSYFLFSLVVGICFLILAVLLSLPLIILAIKGHYYLYLHRDRLDLYVISLIAAWIFVMLLLVFVWALIANFMTALMYRRRCRACEAFRTVTRLCFASFIFAFVSAPVRARIRCVGGLHANGVFADLVTCVARAATFDICVESAARTAFASGWMKRGCERWEKSGRTVRGRAKTGY